MGASRRRRGHRRGCGRHGSAERRRGKVSCRVREYPVPAARDPHDVAPARDGGVWYTAQGSGELGWLDPEDRARRASRRSASGSAPHGVIVGPDGAPWITDGGLNAIVRVDPAHAARSAASRCRRAAGYANLNTAAFDRAASSGSPGRAGSTAGSTRKVGKVRVFRAPRGAGPYGITTTPSGDVYYASLAGSYLGRIDVRTGKATRPPAADARARARGACGPTRAGGSGSASGTPGRSAMYDPRSKRWREWRLPGASPMPYAVYVDERDKVWLSDFGANALVRFDPSTERFTRVALPSADAAVRQILGRPGEVWGAESGTDKLVLVSTR